MLQSFTKFRNQLSVIRSILYLYIMFAISNTFKHLKMYFLNLSPVCVHVYVTDNTKTTCHACGASWEVPSTSQHVSANSHYTQHKSGGGMATQLILIWTNAQTSPKVTSSSFSTSTQQTHNFTPGLFACYDTQKPHSASGYHNTQRNPTWCNYINVL